MPMFHDLPPKYKCTVIGGNAVDDFCEIKNDFLAEEASCTGDLQGTVTDAKICRFPLTSFEKLPNRKLNALRRVEEDRRYTTYVNKHCPDLWCKEKELIQEYGSQRPPTSLADILQEGITVVEFTDKGIKASPGSRELAEKLEKRLWDRFHMALEEDLGHPIQPRMDAKPKTIPKGTEAYQLKGMYMDLKSKKKTPADAGLEEYSRERAMKIVKEEIEEKIGGTWNEPTSDEFLFYQICRLKEDMRHGRTGSETQKQRLKQIRYFIYALSHPMERDNDFMFGRQYYVPHPSE